MIAAAAPLWYITRSTAFVALILFTLTVVLGILTWGRVTSTASPAFVAQGIHRNVSLLALMFLAVHVVSAVVDPFSKLNWMNAMMPFTNPPTPVAPLWIGIGVVAMELTVAIVISSLLRPYISPRFWRQLHWLTYLLWPAYVVHGLGSGTDTGQPWSTGVVVACCLAVLWALIWRVRRRKLIQAAA